jgi:hypothetical protein
MTADRRDLSNLTAPTPRAAGLTLPPRRTAAATPPDALDAGAAREPEVEPDVIDVPVREKTERAKPKKAKPPAPAGRKRPYSAYLPGSLADRLKEAAGTTSYAEWVLDAYRRVHTRLEEVFGPPAADDSGLPPRPRPPRRHVERLTSIQLRLTEQEIDVLERKRAELGGPSKSEFITAVVELHLDEH